MMDPGPGGVIDVYVINGILPLIAFEQLLLVIIRLFTGVIGSANEKKIDFVLFRYLIGSHEPNTYH